MKISTQKIKENMNKEEQMNKEIVEIKERVSAIESMIHDAQEQPSQTMPANAPVKRDATCTEGLHEDACTGC